MCFVGNSLQPLHVKTWANFLDRFQNENSMKNHHVVKFTWLRCVHLFPLERIRGTLTLLCRKFQMRIPCNLFLSFSFNAPSIFINQKGRATLFSRIECKQLVASCAWGKKVLSICISSDPTSTNGTGILYSLNFPSHIFVNFLFVILERDHSKMLIQVPARYKLYTCVPISSSAPTTSYIIADSQHLLSTSKREATAKRTPHSRKRISDHHHHHHHHHHLRSVRRWNYLQYCMMLYHFSEKGTPRPCPPRPYLPCPCSPWETVEEVAWLRGTGTLGEVAGLTD